MLKITAVCRNQFNYNYDLHAIQNKNYALLEPFETDFLTQ